MSNQIDTDAVISHLNGLPRLHSASHVATFRCYREAADGRTQEVYLEIHDDGPTIEQQDDGREVEVRRYRCVARSDDGKAASGNSADKVSTVLSTVHWEDLD